LAPLPLEPRSSATASSKTCAVADHGRQVNQSGCGAHSRIGCSDSRYLVVSRVVRRELLANLRLALVAHAIGLFRLSLV
jgi:hypothetical protein